MIPARARLVCFLCSHEFEITRTFNNFQEIEAFDFSKVPCPKCGAQMSRVLPLNPPPESAGGVDENEEDAADWWKKS